MFADINLSRVCKPANLCIYCGVERSKELRLGMEHVIPLSLSGELIIPKASCNRCAEIIRTFESPILNHFYKDARTHLKLTMREPKYRPDNLRIGVHESKGSVPPSNMADANFRFEQIPVADHPMMLMQPMFPPPDILNNIPPRLEIPLIAINTYLSRNPVSRRPDGTVASPMLPFRHDEFGRFVAKIAHGAVVAEMGFGNFEAFLPQYILGENQYISQVVGTATERLPVSTMLHRIQIGVKNNYIVVHLYLFAKYLTTAWEIVVGR